MDQMWIITYSLLQLLLIGLVSVLSQLHYSKKLENKKPAWHPYVVTIIALVISGIGSIFASWLSLAGLLLGGYLSIKYISGKDTKLDEKLYYKWAIWTGIGAMAINFLLIMVFAFFGLLI